MLYEKIHIQDSMLQQGEQQYVKRLTDLKRVKTEVREQKSVLEELQEKTLAIKDLKKEVHFLQKELLEEQVKVRCLSEELENPMNVHRWRKLEGTDPEAFELITKI